MNKMQYKDKVHANSMICVYCASDIVDAITPYLPNDIPR